LNTEFPWNLFFRILFEIEQCDNKQDFENFVLYIKENIISVEIKEQLQSYFKEDSDKIVDEIYKCVAESITKIDSVEILYNYNLEKIAFNCGEVVGLICREFDTYEEYTNSKEDLLTSFKEKITQIFE